MQRHGLLTCSAAIAIATGYAGTAGAQPTATAGTQSTQAAAKPSDDTVQLEEIIVTAQRTDERLQRIPVPVSALSSKIVERAGVTELANLTQLVPAVQITRVAGPYNTISLRGVSSTVTNQFGDPAVQVNFDQVPQARATGGVGQFFDLERVEVVKGPQGIFYGRNATGGAINVISKSPVLGKFGASVGLDLGNYAQVIVNGAINVPLGNDLAARVAFQTERRDGFFSDGSGDADTRGIRGSLKWEPSDDFSLVLRADYTRDRSNGTGSTAYCAGPPAGSLPAYVGCPVTGRFYGAPFTSISTQQPLINPYYPTGPGGSAGLGPTFTDNTYYSVSAELNWRVIGGTLTVIPAYHHDGLDYFLSNGWNYRDQVDHNQYSTEARFASDQTRPIRFVAGIFYFHDKQSGGTTYDQRFILTPFSVPSSGAFGVPPGTGFPGLNNLLEQNQRNLDTAWAAFGNLTWELTPHLRIAGGIRYTWEKKSTHTLAAFHDAAAPDSPYLGTGRKWADPVPSLSPADAAGHGFVGDGSRSWEDTSYRVGVDWDWRPASMLYATVSTGFKSGGFFINDPTDGIGLTYDPETVTAYTIGSKNQFLGNRLRLNFELFKYDYKNQQVGALLTNTSGKVIYVTANVGVSTMKGAELEGEFLPFRNTLLRGNVQYLDATYDSFQIPNAFLGPAGVAGSRCPAVTQTRFPGATFASDCSGQQMLQAPKWTVQAGIEQTIPLDNGARFVAQADMRWESERELNSGYFLYSRAPSTGQVNASLTYSAPSESWSVTAYARNIGNTAIPDSINAALNQSGLLATTMRPPRQYGVRLRGKF
jgi:iron complex outermembrane receptor protein